MTIVLPHSGPQTSRDAAANPHVIGKAAHDRRLIVEFIASCGAAGATDEQIAAGCPTVNPDAIRARRGEAWARGFITKELGERRATTSGNMAQVWHITRTGIHAAGLGGWAV